MITLCMIVKNEAATLERTLRSVLPAIDRWCIIDTGSTDATRDICLRVLMELPGALHDEPFVDYSTTRNRCLELAGSDGWHLLLSAEEELLDPGELRALNQDACDAYNCQVLYPGCEYAHPRFVRASTQWRYQGLTHEALVGEGRVERCGVRILRTKRTDEQSAVRWRTDIELLQRAILEEPQNPRWYFYLGLTHKWLGEDAQAIYHLENRVRLQGWPEEVWYARLTQARCYMRLGKTSPAVSAYLAAHAERPWRAEPLNDLAAHYMRTGQHALSLLYARRACDLTMPKDDVLFVERAAYEHEPANAAAVAAYYLGELELGRAFAERALSFQPDDPRLQKNLTFYPPG